MLTRAFRPGTLLAAFFLAFSPAITAAEDPLIGTKPPAWQVSDWMNSKPLLRP
jgi:hypothetical protein